MSYLCENCHSTNIIETDDYEAYFREGEWIKLRLIHVWSVANSAENVFFATCPELHSKAIGRGNTELEAISQLGELIHIESPRVALLGERIE